MLRGGPTFPVRCPRAMSHRHPNGHAHDHAHDHAGGSGHGPPRLPHGAELGRLRIVLVLTAGFMGVEVAGGILASSLALLADAGHMLTDVAAIALSLFALTLARRPASRGKTYGYVRL